MSDPARLFDTPELAGSELRRELSELRSLLPERAEVRSAFLRLEAELGDARAVDADSGVRPAPWALQPERPAPIVEALPVLEAPPPPRSRAFAVGSVLLASAAALALWLARPAPSPGPAPRVPAPAAVAQSPETARLDTSNEATSATPGSSAPSSAAPTPIAVARAPARSQPKRSEPPAADPSTGVLNINSIPLSRVVLDGRPLGETPRVQIEVSAGVHTVLFVHPEYGRIYREVRVDAGRAALAAVRFSQALNDATDPAQHAPPRG